MDRRRVQSPITLHVEDVDFKPQVDYEMQRVTVIDLEITEPDALKLIEGLTKRLESEGMFGAIRVRFSGRLVL